MFQINAASGVPIYEQLIQNVARLIDSGVLKPHDRLPSVRGLATDLGINPNTVAKAYREMEARGLTYSSAGKGSFVRERQAEEPAAGAVFALRNFKNACADAHKRHVGKQTLLDIIDEVYEGGQSDD